MKQVDQYFNDGFIIIPNLFTKNELVPVVEAINECVDVVANNYLFKGRKITDKAEKAGFYKRLILFEKQFPGRAVLVHKQGYLPVAFHNIWANERLLNIVEQFIGPEIARHPL